MTWLRDNNTHTKRIDKVNIASIIEKYQKLNNAAARHADSLHIELKKARITARDSLQGWSDYEEAKREYLSQQHIAQVYGHIVKDLGDCGNCLPDA